MAKCKVCGFRLADGMTKCPMCGAEIGESAGARPAHQPKPAQPAKPAFPSPSGSGIKCKVCGNRLPDGADSCPMCGAVYKNAGTQSQPRATPSVPVPVRTQPAYAPPAVSPDYEETEWKEEAEETDDTEVSSEDLIAYGNSLLSDDAPPSAQREAFMAFNAALEMGDPLAHLYLGYCYLGGTGTERDEEKAYEHFSEAHYADIYEGTTMMGLCQYLGLGVSRDPQRGKELLELAKQHGDESAKSWLKRIKRDEKRDRKNGARMRNSDDESIDEDMLLVGVGAAFLGGFLGALFS